MGTVPNPYRAAITGEKNDSQFDILRLNGLLVDAVTLLPQAWSGGVSDDTCDELARLRDDAKTVSQAVVDEFDYAWRGQPPLVDEGAWQVHWRSHVL